MKDILIILFISLVCCISGCSQDRAEFTTIDERTQTQTIVQTIKIDRVWAGHPVGFSLLTDKNRQYVAYYNADRHMMAGQRNLNEDAFSLTALPVTSRETSGGTSTVLGWDSHNYIAMAVDKDGFIHLSGNMHVHPLTYFRSTKPNDISTLVQVPEMVGSNEIRCTYPKFMVTREGDLIFHYRDGASGEGNEIYNLYDVASKKWSRLLDTPLTDGQGLMNAYQSQPQLREDNWYHVYWVWRDTPDCSTNHDLSYMKSPDLKKWYNAFGQPIKMPATLDNKSLIVDPVPVKGGIINLAASLCLDDQKKPLFAYHKYDEAGKLQFYVAWIEKNQWKSKKITDWDYRWEFSGGGSIVSEVHVGEFINRGNGFYELGYSHIKYGSGTFLLNSKLDICGTIYKPSSPVSSLKLEGTFAGLEKRTAGDSGQSSEAGVSYVLKWETLPANRDQARPEPWPSPSQLYLLKLKK